MELESVGRGRTRTSRLRSWLPVLVPVVVLTLVVGGGVLGQGDRAQPGGEVAAAVPTPRETADATPATETPGATTVPAALPQTGAPLPGRILGLTVEDVVDARDSPRRARPDQLVAVRGWLTVAPAERGCERAWHLACRTEARLSASSLPSGPSIRLETQPGVPLRGIQPQDPRSGTWSAPHQAIVIGRFTQPLYRECGLPVAECEPVLTIERLAWIRRAARERPVAYGPGARGAGLEVGEAEQAARETLRASGVDVGDTLLLALFDRATLGLVDPLAAAASDLDPEARLWYLRAVVWRGAGPVVAWVVVHDPDRRIVAAGP